MMDTVSLKNWRFLSLLAAQFLGAFNDNAFKLVVSMAALSLITDPVSQKNYLALTSAMALLPFLLFSGYAGYFADRFAKGTVLRISKAAEVVAMLVALNVFMLGQGVTHLLATLFFLATHSAFFGPSKYGILPEILNAEDLPKANGYINMLTFVAIILGSLGGALLWGAFKDTPEVIGVLLTGVAVLGTVLCLFVPEGERGDRRKHFDINPFGEIMHGVQCARDSRLLAACMAGSALFWMLGGLIYLSVILLGKTQLGLGEGAAASLFAFLATGIAIGSVIAGHIIGKSIRRTVSVWGALIFGVGCVLSGVYATSYVSTAVLMGIIGLGGGLFVVPLVTALQKYAPEHQRGQVMATSGFLDMLCAFLASGVFWVLGTQVELAPSSVIMVAGIASLVGLVVTIYMAPKLLFEAIQSAVYFVVHRIYRIRLVGEGLDAKGEFPQPDVATVFIANHVTYLDAVFISAVSRRPMRFLALATLWKHPFARFFLEGMNAIPFGTGSVKETKRGIEEAQATLRAGGYVCIFPEGALTRTGHLFPFKRGIEMILAGTDAQVVPMYLERLWGSIFSFSGKRFFTKFPKRLPYPLTIAVGKPVVATTPAWRLNRIISELGTESMVHRYAANDTLGRRFIREGKRRLFAVRMSDTTGQRLNSLKLLVGARLAAQWLKPRLKGSQNIGLLLPSSVGGAVANIALALLGKTSVNLNFSLGVVAMEEALVKAEIESILTTRKVAKKFGFADDARLIYFEDAMPAVTKLQRAHALVQALMLPERALCLRWLSGAQHCDATATILFSSGSTATPKAVMLSHANVIANVESVAQLQAHAESDEKEPYAMAGILPFFHSFGISICLWLSAITGRRIAYHTNPLEAKTVVGMMRDEKIGILVTTPTFARHYAAVAPVDALNALRMVILGGEKLTDAMEAQLQTALPQARILQGYGCTELGPVVALNVPDIKHGGMLNRGYAKGSVGKPIPGVSVRIVNPETNEELPPETEGLILVKSASLMRGYYGAPEMTQSVLADGWYVTGDIGRIDADGFLFITDRLARFSKIGGEMVPHGKIEQAIETILGVGGTVAVVAVADAAKGEKLCVLMAEPPLAPQDIHAGLKQSGLPNLWIPTVEMMFVVESLPQLATGKRDLRACKRLVGELMLETA